MERRNCMTCGADLGEAFGWSRMVNCAHCGTAHILRDAVFAAAGSAGVFHDAPGLVRLMQPVQTLQGRFLPVGVVRFSYGRGAWDEFWALDDLGKGAWISVDEGDIALQRPVAAASLPAAPRERSAVIAFDDRDWTVTEAETATCLAFRGQLPEVFVLGDQFTFLNASSGDGRILSGEFWPGGHAWFCGPWIDPFDLGAK
ncbi:DUF4178 domain-containing protein [Stagnihabitans tardus]|uniref:DUF4178 domain-containing protein n=1 Tax=Stagnihabitans tardus TaxID=2699202 RepID=A0AAE4Y8Z4_9RHOB|nr:DUF4178 domain-containing protein [Stagnihabitans tardus]NBZ86903.1 DUF4178 domain-containing protein [Stagnihabitans tardus]